jgi:hypothetical protein
MGSSIRLLILSEVPDQASSNIYLFAVFSSVYTRHIRFE